MFTKFWHTRSYQADKIEFAVLEMVFLKLNGIVKACLYLDPPPEKDGFAYVCFFV